LGRQLAAVRAGGQIVLRYFDFVFNPFSLDHAIARLTHKKPGVILGISKKFKEKVAFPIDSPNETGQVESVAVAAKLKVGLVVLANDAIISLFFLGIVRTTFTLFDDLSRICRRKN
jgi:hypothetical protein